ncbi:MAG: 23S rRNA (pseudouridine(1915)-N(3))-methyltransferase RlmH [Alphaproteobacteria bacterium]|nr:23S rRNA (pseudouridine(1915)-N(3))-methyltransferase RlmH [Alphaproteobacteria bacterium]
MRILVAAVGRARKGPETALFEHFSGRIKVWPFALHEVELKRSAPASRTSDGEADLLLQAVPDGAHAIALDEGGKQLTSEEFSALLGRLQDEGMRDLVFLIGGADGHGEAVRRRADQVLAFGRNTWPHMLVRGLLAEQVYRAQQILAGHPYHRA